LFLFAAVVACGAPVLTPGSTSRAPAAMAVVDTQEISLEISALM
jgi:hypothetical protein